MMMTLFDDEYILKTYTKDIENKKDRETAERMIKAGKLTIEEIAGYVPTLSLDELKKLKSDIMQTT